MVPFQSEVLSCLVLVEDALAFRALAGKSGFSEPSHFLRAIIYEKLAKPAPAVTDGPVGKLSRSGLAIMKALADVAAPMTTRQLAQMTALLPITCCQSVSVLVGRLLVEHTGEFSNGPGRPARLYRMTALGEAHYQTLVSIVADKRVINDLEIERTRQRLSEDAQALSAQSSLAKAEVEAVAIIRANAMEAKADRRDFRGQVGRALMLLALEKEPGGSWATAKVTADTQLGMADSEVLRDIMSRDAKRATYANFTKALHERIEALGGPKAIQERAEERAKPRPETPEEEAAAEARVLAREAGLS